MKQIIQNARTGSLEITEVPAPLPAKGQLLVRNHYSVMSPGTEKLSMSFARSSLLGKARSRPDLVKQVLRKARQDGPLATYRTATTRLEAPQPLGYSSAGVVEAIGPGVLGFAPGDRVACAGAGYANHAELVVVPENLAVHVPPGVGLDQAAFATLGAIAMQGVRVARPTLGETGVVIGLGLIGQLAAQLLRANGCRVLGVDLDAKRLEQAEKLGVQWTAEPHAIPSGWKDEATGGYGADFVVVTASSSSAAPLHLAAELCRLKGRISVVGAVPLELDRRVVYDKELELRMSTSYGPGRYDRSYEELGLDYPLPYVRWTENRNLQSFLELIESGSLDPLHLDGQVCDFADAERSYEALVSGDRPALSVIFRYELEGAAEHRIELTRPPERRPRDEIGVAFIGAGNYAKGELLPRVSATAGVRRVSVVTATGASGRRTAEKFRFATCGTDPADVFADPEVDLVFVTTRHDSHAALAIEGLRAHKAVWLEKPVALDADELDAVVAALQETGGFLAVGYNRRFSPHTEAVRRCFPHRSGPMSIHYRMAAGPTPTGTWLVDPAEGGGRIVGELCHIADLCSFLVGEQPVSVYAHALGRDPEIDDSVAATLSYRDGSVATVEYLAQTSPEVPKERFEVSAEGRTVESVNYRLTQVAGQRPFKTFNQDKGQTAAVAAVLRAVKQAEASPFSIEEIVGVSRTTFAVLESIARGAPVALV